MYKKHRAFGAKPNALFYLQSPPNIKFGVYKKNKSKTLYLAKCQSETTVNFNCPTFLILNVKPPQELPDNQAPALHSGTLSP